VKSSERGGRWREDGEKRERAIRESARKWVRRGEIWRYNVREL